MLRRWDSVRLHTSRNAPTTALGLRWRDILWDRGLIAIRQTWVHMKVQDGAKTKLSWSRVA
jgi:hypothetical protein